MIKENSTSATETLRKTLKNPKATRQLFPSPSRPTTSQPKFLTPNSRRVSMAEHNYARSPVYTSGYYIDRANKLKTRLRTSKLSTAKLKRKVKKLNFRLSDKLKQCKDLEASQISTLQGQFPALLNEFMKQEMQVGKCKTKKGVRYTEEMKKFAVSLHFMSPKAYRFLRKYLTLPHESTLSSWTASADCSAGFCSEVIAQLITARESDKRI